MILTVEDLSLKTTNGRTLIAGLSFAINRGDVLFIRGANGTGKTSLLRTLLGIFTPASGTVTRHIPSERIAFLPQLQNTSMHIPFTLREVLMSAEKSGDRSALPATQGLLKPEQLDLSWNRASGGERQKTLLARALAEGKDLLIVDEPMNHLDAFSRNEVAQALANYTKSGHHALIIVSHQNDNAVFTDARSINLEEYTR